MDCTKYHELISAYVDEETSAIQRQALEAHMESCQNCKAYLSNQIKLKDMIRESYLQTADIDLSASIMSRIQPVSGVKKTSSRMKKISLFVAAAAAVCVIAMATMMSLHVDKNTVAGNEKLEEYVIEHVGSGSSDFNGQVEAVNIEK